CALDRDTPASPPPARNRRSARPSARAAPAYGLSTHQCRQVSFRRERAFEPGQRGRRCADDISGPGTQRSQAMSSTERGRDLNPRPLGYEPYNTCLSRLWLSLASAVTSADGTEPISLRRLCLPCLKLSRRVRFTNRFTEQAIDLQFPHPSAPFH